MSEEIESNEATPKRDQTTQDFLTGVKEREELKNKLQEKERECNTLKGSIYDMTKKVEELEKQVSISLETVKINKILEAQDSVDNNTATKLTYTCMSSQTIHCLTFIHKLTYVTLFQLGLPWFDNSSRSLTLA